MATGRTSSGTRRGRRRTAFLVATACIACVAAALPARAERATAPRGPDVLRVRVADADLPRGVGVDVVVTDLAGAVPVAEVTLTGKQGLAAAANVSVDDDLAVTGGQGTAGNVFKGEIVAIEPTYHTKNINITLRAYNRLHRLTRGLRTRAFTDVTDADLVRVVAAENDLLADPSPDLVARHPTVLQQNETDLAFLRARAARLGYEVFVDGMTLRFAAPRER